MTRSLRGLSLLEMLVSIVIVAVVMGAVSRSFVFGLTTEHAYEDARNQLTNRVQFEERMLRLIAGATLAGGSGYLRSPVPVSAAGVEQHPLDGGLGPGSASLVLTTFGISPSTPYLNSEQVDFEGLNRRFGPQGGVAEVAFSTVPVGDAGLKNGLFLREQRPADGDATQGGEESLLNEEVRDIRFEFYDGSSWQTAWDTESDQKGKLPAAVRVTYLLLDEETPHVFLVRLPMGGA